MNLDALISRVQKVCEKRGWDKSALPGGCYIHLEVSEFIEALRGKGNSTPVTEAGDVLIALFAVMSHYNITASQVLQALEETLDRLEKSS